MLKLDNCKKFEEEILDKTIERKSNKMKTVKYLNEIKNDNEYTESIITEVEKDGKYYKITKNDGWQLCIDDIGIEPKFGDTIRIYGKQKSFRGIAINNNIIFYKTVDEEKKHRLEKQKIKDEIDKKKYIHNIWLFRYRYNNLPGIFRRRIDSFVINNPDFYWKYYNYELFCCEQAVMIAKNLGSII